MPVMVGFSQRRKTLLLEELDRVRGEFPSLGLVRVWLAGDFSRGFVNYDTPLEFLIIQETTDPYPRRADFFTDHLRPQVETHFHVYNPDEFSRGEHEDRFVKLTLKVAELIYG
ncbi:MAG: hypothetical protein VYD09_01525 [Chloroflexota bacterium]|nr:hypothetical protein [Chloroflexota bacterium]